MSSRPLSRRDRLLLASCAAFLVGGFAVARSLEPSPTGIGTHEQLGLPACGLLTWTGVPCPGCGLTTSISYLMHGELRLSWQTQPIGVVTAAIAIIAIAVCSDAALSGRWRLRADPLWLAIAAVWALNIIAIGRWIAGLLIG